VIPRPGLLVAGFALAGPVSAQQPARPQPVILGFPSSVQAAGLAGAGVALPGYAGAIFVNPAGIAPIRVLSIEGGFSVTPDRSTYSMAAGATRLGSFNVGFGGRYLRFPSSVPTLDNLSWVGALVYRRGGIALGSAAKYVSVEDRAGTITRSVTSDLALQVAFFDIAAIAISGRNLGEARISGDGLDLPQTLSMGFSFNLLDTYSNGRLMLTLESTWAERDRRRTVVGLEGGAVFYGLGLVARAGSGPQPGVAGNLLSNTTIGGSVLLGRARLDYAYQHRSVIGSNVHLFGGRWTP
jgi:hypothetical protein